jgi:hypothetical protein
MFYTVYHRGMNAGNTRKLRKISASRSPSPVGRPVFASLNQQNAYTGLVTPMVAETMNMNSVAKQIQIRNNTRSSRPSSASFHTPIRPQSVSYNRPKSATVIPVSFPAEQAHHGQLKTIHANLQRQQGSRSLLRTRRRKSRRNRNNRRKAH